MDTAMVASALHFGFVFFISVVDFIYSVKMRSKSLYKMKELSE